MTEAMAIRITKHQLLERVEQLENSLERGTKQELWGCLESAVQLIDACTGSGDIESEERLQTAAKLIDLVESTIAENIETPDFELVVGLDKAEAHSGGFRVEEKPALEDLQRINDMLLGGILDQLGLVSELEVEAALQVQSQTGKRLGEALVAIGATTAEDIQTAINIQGHLRAAAQNVRVREKMARAKEEQPDMEAHLGEILIGLGAITRDQLAEALRIQQMADLRIGTAIVAIGACTWGDIWSAVRVQKQLRQAVDAEEGLQQQGIEFDPGYGDSVHVDLD